MDTQRMITTLLGLYDLQTQDEQQDEQTKYRNNVGFNHTDAAFCTSIVEQLLSGRFITRKQIAALQRIIPKYKKQANLIDHETMAKKLSPAVLEYLKSVDNTEGGNPSTQAGAVSKKKSQGILQFDTKQRLEFIPYVYPTAICKEAGFRKGDREKWSWVHEFSFDAYAFIVEHFPDVEVAPGVNDQIKQLLLLNKVPKEIEQNKQLFPFQKESIQFLTSRNRALLALAPGLGKTACSIFGAEIKAPGSLKLVIAPLSLMRTWQKEIKKWAKLTSIVWHGNPNKWEYEDETWIITNYDTAVRYPKVFIELPFEIVIVDESVLIKNRKALRTQVVKNIVKDCPNVWLLSGAPTTRFYDDMWSQVNILKPKKFTSYWRFAGTYCNIMRNHWGVEIVSNKDNSAIKIQHDLQDLYFARTQDQVLELPDFIVEDIEVPMSAEEYKVYRDMEKKFLAHLPPGDDVIKAKNILTQILRLVQISSNASILGGGKEVTSQKWKSLVELLGFVEHPCIVWVNFIETSKRITELIRKAGYTCDVLTGETKEAERQRLVDQFQAGQLDVLVAHPGVGKFGLTLTAGRTAIYLERTYNGDDYFQSLHRIRRIGTHFSPRIIHLLSVSPTGTNTIDHVISRVLSYRKEKNIELTTGLILKSLGGLNGQ